LTQPLSLLRRPPERRDVALDATSAGWLAAGPTVALVLAAMAALGPTVGRLVLPTPDLRFWGEFGPLITPEPTEHARFLIALTAPLLLAALTALLARRPAPFGAPTARLLVAATQATFVAVLVACFVIQWTYRYPPSYVLSSPVRWFLLPTLLAAAAIAAALLAGARVPRIRTRFAALTAETRGRRAGASLVALALLAATLLPAIATDDSLALSHDEVVYHLQFTFDETMAVVNGRSPLGDFAAQYSSLWPYVAATAMQALGVSVLGFTLAMALLTGAAMLALLDVLRRLTRSTVAALLLFLPLLATSAYRLHGTADVRFSLVNYFGTMPLRYAGPFLLAWLLARHLDGARPRRVWPLFLAGGLVAINNVDFGVPALVATVAALAWARSPLSRRALGALAAQAAIGLAGALALVTGLLLLRTGEPPDISLAFRYARIFAQGGFVMQAIRPLVGLSTIVFLTYLAALGTATVRATRGEPDRLLTGLLAWSGTFGLCVGGYYVGHSIPEVLTNMFPIWALTLVLLTLVVVRRLARADAGRPTLPELACLFAFGVLACSLAQTPKPWTQLDRIAGRAPAVFREPPAQPFIAARVRPGERVAMLLQLGHHIADNLGIEDVTPYTGPDSIKTLEQLEETLRALRREHGRKVFLAFEPGRARLTAPGLDAMLPQYGLRLEDQGADGALQMWVTR
jgi:hypothetical protein